MPVNYIKKYLSKEELDSITNHIAETEKFTSGEIRICFNKNTAWAERKLTSREMAVKEFHKLGMHNTKDKTGVLLYVLFKDRKFEVVADTGINDKISAEKWDVITNHLIGEFKSGNYKAGIIKALDEIKEVLMKEFPRKADDTNELPNDIVIK
ncbi:MAG: TPM domain-containing protein [Ignavibacteriota bacterium]